MKRNIISAAQKAAESEATALLAQAQQAASKNRKGLARALQEKADVFLAQADRFANVFFQPFRGHQMAIAMVNAAVQSKTSVARRIADSARSIANQV